jgi:2-oxo-4-hydroxy-4-carboxy-5-ureidoimidazoline decarboxylase
MTELDANVRQRSEGSTPPRLDEAVARFNDLRDDAATHLLLHCLEAESWAKAVLAGRPYGTRDELDHAASIAAGAMDDAALESALAAHPRIGERPTGTGAAASFSRAEQSGVDPADLDVATRLRLGNLAYEERFGHVFLIRAAGRSADEILGALTERLANDPGSERAVVKEQLGQIAVLRLHQQLTALKEAS